MIFDLANFSSSEAYHLMTQTVMPRPIAWVLTTNKDKTTHNLAPFSYFNAVSSNPPLLMFSCAPKSDGSIKDTVINIERDEKFIIHIATENQMQTVQDTAKPLDYGSSELMLTDLQLTAFDSDSATDGLQRIASAPIAFVCTLYKKDLLGNAPQTLIFAEIKSVYIDDNAIQKNDERLMIDASQIKPLARLGANQYSSFGNIIKPTA